jgi:hypothetical protein
MTNVIGHLIFQDELTNKYIRAYYLDNTCIAFYESGLDDDLLKFDLLESPDMNLGPYSVQYNKAFDWIETQIPWDKLSDSLQAYYVIDNALHFIGFPLVYKELYNEKASYSKLYDTLSYKTYHYFALADLPINNLCLNDLFLLVEYLNPLVLSKETSDETLYSITRYLKLWLQLKKHSDCFSYIKHEFQALYEHPNLRHTKFKFMMAKATP